MDKKETDKTVLYRLLATRFGAAEFRPLQYQVIQDVLCGGDRVVVMGTGSGKSLCYLLPALLLKGVTLVVSPLRSLIRDQLRRAEAAGLAAVLLEPSLRRREAARADIIFTSPERLFTGRSRRFLSSIPVGHLVLDEAHCVETWGGSFRPYLGLLADAVALYGRERVSLFTASAGQARVDTLAAGLGLKSPVFLKGDLDRPELRWHAGATSLPEVAAARLLSRRRGAALVYCGTRRASEEAALFFSRAGLIAAPYHAGMAETARRTVQDRFAGGGCRILCATSAFGMGVDIGGIRTVIHLGLPRSLDAYQQEAGRAGRDGKAALALLLYRPEEACRRDSFPLQAVLREGAGGLPRQELDEEAFLAGLAELGGGRLPEAALYAFLLANGIYLRVAGERGAVVRPHNLPGIKGGLCRLLRAEETAWRQVREYVAGKECRRRPLLAAYDARPGRCGGCDHCGSEYSWQVGAALQFTERLAALGRRIAGLPLHHGLALLQGAELGGAERTLAEYAVFRNS